MEVPREAPELDFGVDGAGAADGRGSSDPARMSRCFSLSQGPLSRWSLLRWSSDRWSLLVVVHHAAGDGWSQGELFRQLEMLYASAESGRFTGLGEGPQYGDWSLWQRSWLEGELRELKVSLLVGSITGSAADSGAAVGSAASGAFPATRATSSVGFWGKRFARASRR